MAAAPPEPPDDDLESLRPDLDEFYKKGSISAYFYTRLAVLASVNEHREQFVAWANEGVSFRGVPITIPSVESEDDTPDPPSANGATCCRKQADRLVQMTGPMRPQTKETSRGPC